MVFRRVDLLGTPDRFLSLVREQESRGRQLHMWGHWRLVNLHRVFLLFRLR